MSDVTGMIGALHFAAHKHRSQPRKDEAKTPYINHVIAVVHTLATVGRVTDPIVLVSATLHDTIEENRNLLGGTQRSLRARRVSCGPGGDRRQESS